MPLISVPLPQYEGGEPCSICGHVMLPAGGKAHDSCMPTTIISGFLYLGSYDTASRQELLRSLNISHILNVSCSAEATSVLCSGSPAAASYCCCCFLLQTVPTCPALYKNTFVYHTVEDVPPKFEECFQFLGACVRCLQHNSTSNRAAGSWSFYCSSVLL